MIETEGLTHVQLAVTDVKRSLAFYQRVFGMEIQFWAGEDMVFIRTPGHPFAYVADPDGYRIEL